MRSATVGRCASNSSCTESQYSTQCIQRSLLAIPHTGRSLVIHGMSSDETAKPKEHRLSFEIQAEALECSLK